MAGGRGFSRLEYAGRVLSVAGMTEKRAKKTSFEDELKKLEDIVRALESGDIPLGELVARYEEGTRHLRACREFLSDAELRLEQLRAGADKPEPMTLPPPGTEG